MQDLQFLEGNGRDLIYSTLYSYDYVADKGKAIPLQAWTGPEVSRRLRLPDFKTIGTRRW